MRTARLLFLTPVALALLAGPVQAAGPVGGARLAGNAVVTGAAADPAPPAVTAAAYVVADLDTGDVLAAKDPHGAYAPASTLKTLTALTLIPRLDPELPVRPTREDVDVDGSKVGLVTSLVYPVKDLFPALLMSSGNDAAGALATAVGGQAVAAGLMNEEADRLQALDTRAVNTHGLDAPGQVTSAYDLALIARAGMALPDFRRHVATRRAFIAAPDGATIEIGNHNRLLASYPGAIGIKSGYTSQARASFVGAATRDGKTLVVTLMRAEPAVAQEAAALLDWGFAALARDARPVGQLVGPVVAAPTAAPGPAAEPERAAAPAPAAQAAVPTDDGGLPWGRTALVAGGAVCVLGVLRRRAVVKQRARRRRRARSSAARQPAGV